MADWPMINVEQEWTDVTTISEFDPEWRFVDGAGHGHFYGSEGETPTLRWVVDRDLVNVDSDDEEMPESGHYECPHCGEEISPQSRMGNRRQIPGVKHYMMTIRDGDESVIVYKFGEAQFEELCVAVASAVDATLGDYCVQRSPAFTVRFPLGE